MKNFKTVIMLGLAICGLFVQLACQAQNADPNPANATTPQGANAAPPDNDAIIKELMEMKARIARLEAELKAASDANAIRTAEGDRCERRSEQFGGAGGVGRGSSFPSGGSSAS
jgi:hypothetical protein